MPLKIGGAHEVWLREVRLRERIETPFTLRGLVAELADRGWKVDDRTVWKFVHRTGYSQKSSPGFASTGACRSGQPATRGLEDQHEEDPQDLQ